MAKEACNGFLPTPGFDKKPIFVVLQELSLPVCSV